jgi:hypothetical protein
MLIKHLNFGFYSFPVLSSAGVYANQDTLYMPNAERHATKEICIWSWNTDQRSIPGRCVHVVVTRP